MGDLNEWAEQRRCEKELTELLVTLNFSDDQGGRAGGHAHGGGRTPDMNGLRASIQARCSRSAARPLQEKLRASF